MIYLSAIQRTKPPQESSYPLSTPLCAKLDRLDFNCPVTMIVGDNGTGKTTLMELLSVKTGAVRITDAYHGGEAKNAGFSQAQSFYKTEMRRKPQRSFLFKAEDYICYIDEFQHMRQEAEDGLEDVGRRYANRSAYARGLAEMPYHSTLYQMGAMYEGDISARSHGESFLEFFSARIIDNGLYLLDEPEAALSYKNQLVLLHLIARAERRGCQLIVSTHSPILPAYPGARILEIRDGELCPTTYDDMEGIGFLRMFLKDRVAFLKHLGED